MNHLLRQQLLPGAANSWLVSPQVYLLMQVRNTPISAQRLHPFQLHSQKGELILHIAINLFPIHWHVAAGG
jgi:hypothetical protein